MKKFLLATGLALGIALVPAAAQANGGDAVVGATINLNGSVHVQSTKGLSRVTVVTCDGVRIFDSWDGEQHSADLTIDGVVQAVFIHSGNNTLLDAQALLTLLAGADEVKGNSTGAIAFYNADACDHETPTTTTTTTQPPVVTTTTTAPPVVTTTTTAPPVTTTTQPPTTPTTTVVPDDGPHYITCADGSVVGLGAVCPVETTEIAGETITKAPATPVSGELPHTGAGETFALIGVGLGLIGLGLGFRSLRHKNAS